MQISVLLVSHSCTVPIVPRHLTSSFATVKTTLTTRGHCWTINVNLGYAHTTYTAVFLVNTGWVNNITFCKANILKCCSTV